MALHLVATNKLPPLTKKSIIDILTSQQPATSVTEQAEVTVAAAE